MPGRGAIKPFLKAPGLEPSVAGQPLRKSDRERTSPPELTLYGNLTTQQAGQIPGDGQAQASPLMLTDEHTVPSFGRQGLAEPLEDPLAIGLGDPHPCIRHGDDDVRAVNVRPERDPSPARRELDRVG